MAITLTKDIFPDRAVVKEQSSDEMLAELTELRKNREKIINP